MSAIKSNQCLCRQVASHNLTNNSSAALNRTILEATGQCREKFISVHIFFRWLCGMKRRLAGTVKISKLQVRYEKVINYGLIFVKHEAMITSAHRVYQTFNF